MRQTVMLAWRTWAREKSSILTIWRLKSSIQGRCFNFQVQNINVLATEEQLIDFLYKLGSGASMIRVRDLELQPDQAHQKLSANIKLVASYQKNPVAAAAKKSTAKAK